MYAYKFEYNSTVEDMRNVCHSANCCGYTISVTLQYYSRLPPYMHHLVYMLVLLSLPCYSHLRETQITYTSTTNG